MAATSNRSGGWVPSCDAAGDSVGDWLGDGPADGDWAERGADRLANESRSASASAVRNSFAGEAFIPIDTQIRRRWFRDGQGGGKPCPSRPPCAMRYKSPCGQ